MDLYTFTELSNEQISLKGGIFKKFLMIRIVTSVTFGTNWKIKFPKIFVKNAISNDRVFTILEFFFKEILLKSNASIQILMKNDEF